MMDGVAGLIWRFAMELDSLDVAVALKSWFLEQGRVSQGLELF
jgi:hypothetical protein